MLPNFWPTASGLKIPGAAWISGLLAVVLALLLPSLLLLGGFAIDLMGWEHQRIEQISLQQAGSASADLRGQTASEYTSIGPFRWKLSETPWVGTIPAPQKALGAALGSDLFWLRAIRGRRVVNKTVADLIQK